MWCELTLVSPPCRAPTTASTTVDSAQGLTLVLSVAPPHPDHQHAPCTVPPRCRLLLTPAATGATTSLHGRLSPRLSASRAPHDPSSAGRAQDRGRKAVWNLAHPLALTPTLTPAVVCRHRLRGGSPSRRVRRRVSVTCVHGALCVHSLEAQREPESSVTSVGAAARTVSVRGGRAEGAAHAYRLPGGSLC